MARNKSKWFQMRSKKAGRKTAKRIKKNFEILNKLTKKES